ncbi:hypothetical protein [Parapedobacter tibetensis]|uniref:hypothetical protein n=1 Tax=Parapedobacter tibetensis TaxID=2972951 RepID=UPI00214D67E4|nr:hypothetical protein [Parapedobacter tibetensis]
MDQGRPQLPECIVTGFYRGHGRWYGVRFKNLHCIPESKRVSASICYRAPLTDVLAAINKAGVRVYQSNGEYSFCEPDSRQHTPKVLAHHGREACDYCGQPH